MTVAIATEPEFRPGAERPLLHPPLAHLGGWDLSPDGSRFVVVGRLASAGTTGMEGQVHVRDIHVILNNRLNQEARTVAIPTY